MRNLELILVAVLLVRMVWPAIRMPGLRGRRVFGLVLLAALGLHVWLEGRRWNLFPLYGLALMILVRDVVFSGFGPRAAAQAMHPVRRVGVPVLGVALTAVLVGPGWLFPVPRMPAPTGPFAVGTDSIEFDLPADLPFAIDGVTRARARVWYPADTTTVDATSVSQRCGDTWLEHEAAMLPTLATRAGLPAFALGHLEYVSTYACWGVDAVVGEPLPVITFDHGRRGFAAQNTFLAEELASHGWLVVATDHPEGAILSVFRDGERIPFNEASFGGGLEGTAYEDAIRGLGERWIAVTQAALDALEAGLGPSTLVGRMDRSRLVATGHSTGGGTAFGVCAAEAGCLAAIGLDPWMLPMPPRLFVDGLTAPLLGIFSDPALGFFEPINREAFDELAEATNGNGAPATARTYPNAGHMDVTDVTLLSPIADRLGLYVGPAAGPSVIERTRVDTLTLLETLPRSNQP